MKTESVKKMLAAEYNWDEADFSVKFNDTYLGDMQYTALHLNGAELIVSVRILDLTHHHSTANRSN